MSAPTRGSGRLLHSPVVLRDGQWWLISSAGAILATDPALTGTLDRFSIAAAAADAAVAELRARQDVSSTSCTGSER